MLEILYEMTKCLVMNVAYTLTAVAIIAVSVTLFCEVV